MEKETKLILLISVFISGITVTNLISSKIMTLFGLTFSAGALAYALTFPMTDVISEIWGKKKAYTVIWAGFLSSVVMIILVYIAIHSSPAFFWQNQKSYENTLGLVGRIALGSMVAYLISQHHDVWAFDFWKRKAKSKHLWFRNNASTTVSQLIDSVIFIFIAFYGILPNSALIPTILGQFIIKMGIAFLDTPIVYLLVKWSRG